MQTGKAEEAKQLSIECYTLADENKLQKLCLVIYSPILPFYFSKMMIITSSWH